jgi:predicted amidohydrolase YtcJ
MRSTIALIAGLLLLTSPALTQPADMVLRGGKVITVDKDWRIAQAVAVKDGRFVAVGSIEEMAARIGPGTQIVELGGKTVVPGLIDSHLHLLFATLNWPAVQLLGAKSVADVQKAIG